MKITKRKEIFASEDNLDEKFISGISNGSGQQKAHITK